MAIQVVMMYDETEGTCGLDIWQEIVYEKSRGRFEAVLATGEFEDGGAGLGSARRVAVSAGGKITKHLVGSENVIAVNIGRIAQEVKGVGLRELPDQGKHGLIRGENILPRRDELRLRALIPQHVENAAEEGRAVDLPVLVAQLHAVDCREHLAFVVNLAMCSHCTQRGREVKFQEDVTDVEEEGADQGWAK